MKKRILSLVLVLCMALSLLPMVAFAADKTINPTANTLEALYSAFAQAQSGDTVQLTGDISTATELLRRIPISKAVSLDLNGHTISYHGTGTSLNESSGLFFINSGGSLTIKGETGHINLDQKYSALVQVNAGGKLIIESGSYAHSGVSDTNLIISAGGTVDIKGGTLSCANGYVLLLQNGTLSLSGGTLSSVNSYAAVLNNVAATVSGGTITGGSSAPTAYLAMGSSLTMNKGEIKSTGANIALLLMSDCQPSTISGGKITAPNSFGIMAYSSLSISGDAEITSNSSVAVRSDGTLNVSGGTIKSTSGMALINAGSMTMTDGTVSSDSGHGFYNMASADKTATISGGSITSGSSIPAVNNTDCTMSISGGSITTAGGACAVFNNAGGTVNVTGGTLSGKTATIINNGAGTINFSAGTINSIVNYNAAGKTVIDGGSVKLVQGTAPKNSDGDTLRQYPIQITGKASTLIVDGELSFNKAVKYSFSGVETDQASMVYLWLPEGLTSATYTKDETTLTGGVAAEGNTTVLPNFTATVKFKLNGKDWTGYNTQVLLSTQAPAPGVRIPTSPIYPIGNINGVYTFSGLVEGETYYIWEKHILGFICKSDTLTLTSETPEKTVSYYQAFLHPGTGIETPEVEITALEGEDVSYSTNFIKAGYKFKNWVYTDGGKQYSADASLSIKGINAFYELTAMGEIDYYTATVTVQKDNKEWADHGKTIVLSPSATEINAEGATDDLTKVSSLVSTYYVWADGEYTGQTITKNSPAAKVDYYTVTVTGDENIESATADKALVLKGGTVKLTANPISGKVFSRWEDADGALYSAESPLTITGITAPVTLTAVGAVEKFTATVTVNLDGGNHWTEAVKHPTLVLSTSKDECGAISGTYKDGVYTFANLSGVTGYYYLWDANTLQLVDETAITAEPITVNYYSVTVNDEDDNVSVSGGGVYLAGSNVTLTATPARFYSVLWDGADTSANTYTIKNISAAATVEVTAAMLTYTGRVTLKLDGGKYDGAAVVLKAEKATEITTTGAQGVYSSASQLDPTREYAVWVNGKDTGSKLTATAHEAALDYFSVSVTANYTTVKADGAAYTAPLYVLKGSDVMLTATPDTGYAFINWKSGDTVLSTNAAFTVTNITEKQTLTATASDKFDAVIIISGIPVSSITLSDGTNTKTTESTSSPYTFSNLDRTKTYTVWVNGENTGKTVSASAASAVLQYYYVALTAGNGIVSVSPAAKNYYLSGSDVPISATVKSGYTFSGWSGTNIFAGTSTTIKTISKNYTLTAAAYVPYTGDPFNLADGQIVIEDDTANAGKIKVTQKKTTGDVITDNLDPNAPFVITGTSNINNAISIIASRGATVQLRDVDIQVNGFEWSAFNIADTAGPVRLILEGTNVLKSSSSGTALKKANSANLTIESIDGTTGHSMSTVGKVGIGNIGMNITVQNITINSGNIFATGAAAALGVSSGGNSGSLTGITLNGGLLNMFIIGTNGIGTKLSNLTINGGTLFFKEGSNAIRSTILQSTDTSNVQFTGGSIHAEFSISQFTPTNGSSALTMVTVATGQNSTDFSGLTITKSGDASYTYGTTDLWTDADGNLYLWLPNGTFTLTIGDFVSEITVPSSNSTTLTKKTYSVNTPEAVTQYGVTFTPAVSPSASIEKEATVTVTATLSGMAAKSGTYVLGLSGTGIGTVATQTLDVTQNGAQSGNKTFSFTMPAVDISDLSLTVSFAETPRHTVSYAAPDADGGSVPVGTSYYEGEQYTIAGNTGTLTRTGYAFKSWNDSGTKTMGSADVTYTAQWTANTYTVKFNANTADAEGSMSGQSFTYDATAAALTTNGFTREGYTFAGWAEGENGVKKYDDKASVKNLSSTNGAEITLYALWKPNSYTVTFANGGGTGSMESQSFLYNTAQALSPNTFTREGYTFAGWKKDASTSYKNGESIPITQSMTLTAQWAAISYSVKFEANGGTGTISEQAFTYGTAQKLSKNAVITRAGYTFTGWNTQADGKGTSYTDEQSVSNLTAAHKSTVTLYAVWEANTYTVSFNENAADVTGTTDSKQFTYDDTAKALTANGFTRSGYTFAGWNTKNDGSGTAYTDEASVKNLTSDKNGSFTLYAVWTADIYTLSFNNGGGNGSMTPQNFATGDTAAISASTFTRAGYHFTGWKDDKGKSVTTVADVGRSTVLTAQWEANSYTVAFNANGGTGSMSSMKFTYDASQPLTKNTILRDGYKFLGWSENPTATTATYADGASVHNLTSMQDGTVTLYAVWQSDTYAVSFNANGGEGLMGALTITNGQSGILSANGFTRDGYKFAGWNTLADGKGIYYPAGASVSFTPDSSGIVTLFAMWTLDVRYTISGTVTDPGAVKNATLALMQGKDVIATGKTNGNGEYIMTDIAPGVYNLVAEKDGKTVTTLVIVTNKDVITDVTVPAANSSTLVVSADPGEDAPKVVVGGLDTVASTKKASIELTVTAKAEDKKNGQQSAILSKLGGSKLEQFLDVTLMQGAADIGDDNETVLELILPFDFSGKTNVKVWRNHKDTVEEFEVLSKEPDGSFTDKTLFADSKTGLIHIYTSRFSLYALSYQQVLPSSSYSITINPAENGTVKTDKTSAEPGARVTVTVTSNVGYTLKSLAITDKNGNSISYTNNKDGTFIFTMPQSDISVSAKFAKTSKIPFIDVEDTDYFFDAVIWAVDNGVTNGTSATTFSPDMTCTRAQAVTFLWRALGSPEPASTSCPFKDVSMEAYYYKAVLWATEKGVTIGTSAESFSPNNTVTRGQTVTFLWRAAGTPTQSAANPFRDVPSGAYYESAVLWAVAEKITEGTANDTFSPANGCTRAQIVTFLWRYLGK